MSSRRWSDSWLYNGIKMAVKPPRCDSNKMKRPSETALYWKICSLSRNIVCPFEYIFNLDLTVGFIGFVKKQLQDDTRNIWVLGVGATIIRDLPVGVYFYWASFMIWAGPTWIHVIHAYMHQGWVTGTASTVCIFLGVYCKLQILIYIMVCINERNTFKWMPMGYL